MTTLQLIFVILAAISAALTITGKLRDSKRLEYVFKPLTMIWIIGIALAANHPISDTYQIVILLGLAASLAGDVFLMLPSDKFLYGLIAFLIAHLFYIAAFTIESTGRAPLWYAIPFLLFGGAMLVFLWPHLGSMRGPVMVYMAAILLMAWQAANRWIDTEQDGTLLALVGAYFFVASDSVLAVERFRGTWRSAPFWVLSLYFLAQGLIALSV